MNQQGEQIKKTRVAQATGATQLTQYLNVADVQHSQHTLGPAAKSAAGSIYSDPGAFSTPGNTPHTSSHGAPNDKPSDYESVCASDANDNIDEQQTNIQQQQAQISSIAQASLDVQPTVPA